MLNSTCVLCAFDLQYGSLFSVKGITLQDAKPVLPFSRGKYANVRILDKATFDFLKTCTSLCKQPAGSGEIKLAAIRAAKTRPGMWIADVSVDEKWLLTFLVFQNGTQVDVVSPDTIHPVDRTWFEGIRRLLQTHVSAGDKED